MVRALASAKEPQQIPPVGGRVLGQASGGQDLLPTEQLVDQGDGEWSSAMSVVIGVLRPSQILEEGGHGLGQVAGVDVGQEP